jgi:O-antigen/teichoic acid export membrane protein
MGSLVLTQAIRLASNLVLAHLLSPEDFGLAAIVAGLLVGLRMFSDVGLAPSIVRSRRGDDPAFLRTAFTFQATRGVALWLASCAAAWPMAALYGAALLPLVPIAGLTAVIGGLTSIHLLLATRNFDQRAPARLEVVSLVVNTLATIAISLVHPSVWAIVGGWLAGDLARAFLSHAWVGRWRDRFGYEPQAITELAHFGRWVFASSAVTFLSQQADRLMLGIVVPASVLGVYGIASMLARLPADVVSRLTESVLFPALADGARTDRSTLEQRLAKARRVLLPICVALNVGVACAGPVLFLGLYPSTYRDAVWMTPLLAGALWFSLLQATLDRVPLVTGHVRSLAIANFVRAVLAIVGGFGGHFIGKQLDAGSEPRLAVAGFIVGLAISSFAGYAVIAGVVARLGVRTLGADARATFLFAAIVLVVFTSVGRWDALGAPGGLLGGWLILGGSASVLVCVWALRGVAIEMGWFRH